MGRRIRSPHAFALALLTLGLATTPAAAEPGTYALECETAPGGVRSVLLVAGDDAPLAGRELGPYTFVIEVGNARLPGIAPGRARCSAATSVQVIPGTLLGLDHSRIVIEHAGPAPRVVSSPGQMRLLWMPAVVASRPEEPGAPRQEPAPQAPPRSERKSAARAPAREERGEDPLPAGTAGKRDPETSPDETPRPEVPAARGEPGPRPPVPIAAVSRLEGTRPPAAPEDFRPVDPPRALVTVIAVQLRTGPGRRFTPGRQLAEGAPLVADGRTADWYRLQGGEWVFAADVRAPEDLPQPGGRSVRVSAPSAQVHAGPGRHFEVVADVRNGETLVLDDRRGEWVHVRNGGWIQLSQVDEKR